MLTDTRCTTKEVVDGLYLGDARRWDASLHELSQPLQAHPGSRSDLSLIQLCSLQKLICRSQKVHGHILAKCYPTRKKNITQATCQNVSLWQRGHKITSGRVSRPSEKASRPS
jgi:hypothetical protein